MKPIILFRALPVILPQLMLGADILCHYRWLVFWAIAIPGTYVGNERFGEIKKQAALSESRRAKAWKAMRRA